MSTTSTSPKHHVARNVGLAVGMLAFVIVMMMWLTNVFHKKISGKPVEGEDRPIGQMPLVPVEQLRVPVTESAVGTVRPVHEVSVGSKILAKVLEVHVKAGDQVTKNMVLVKLDDVDLKARLAQARAAVAAERAVRDQAKVENDRVQTLFAAGNETQIERNRAENAFRSAEANLEGAEQALKGAEAQLDYATIRSAIDGVVVDKRVDVGDMVTPGQVLLTLYDPSRMQLVASVRESLTHRLKVGQNIDVTVDAMGHACQGQVSEIVPQAESASRTFLVKVTGPCPPGVYAGMFGRLTIPLNDEEILVIPRAAVRKIGQVDVVDVAEGQFLRRRAVELGRSFGDKVEVLSGLRVGEKVAVGNTEALS
jgi:RND family efflux transporter MFP subunit